METDKVFAGAVPQVYDRDLGPILFQPFAEAVAERLGDADRAILETAAGTGIVTRAIAAAMPRSTIVATDLNQTMLDVAAERAKTGSVTWRQADAQALPFEAGAFDVAVCCFGIMFMPDKVAAHREARRVLRPAGRLILTIWDRIEANPLMHIAEETLAGLFPDDPPRFFSRDALRLQRQGPDRARAARGRLRNRPDRGGPPRRRRAGGAAGGDRLLPRHAAAQRDRGARSRRPRPRHRRRSSGAPRPLRRRPVPRAPAGAPRDGGVGA